MLLVLTYPAMAQDFTLLRTFWSIHNHYLEEELQTQPSGAQDFEFLTGCWKVHNRYRSPALHNSREWVEFEGHSDVERLSDGLGNVDHYSASRNGKAIQQTTLRVFNPASGNWFVYRSDTAQVRVLDRPLVGKFTDHRGEFFGEKTIHGRKVQCRSVWTRSDNQAPRYEEAFSEDNGRTWRTDWIMTLTKIS